VRLARKNDDPILLRDLQRLSGRGSDTIEVIPASRGADGEAGLAASAPTTTGNADLDAARAALAAFKGPEVPPEVAALQGFEQKFVRLVLHVRRYVPFYAGAAVWLFAILLIQPMGGGSDEPSGALATSAQRPNRAVTAGVTAEDSAPPFDAFGGSAVAGTSYAVDVSSSSSSGFTVEDDDDSFAGSATAPSSPPGSDDETIDFGDDLTTSASTPKPLSIAASGYASSTGGTPVEQDPAKGGLPVASTAGQDQKISFIRLVGDETVLRLKVSADGPNVNEAAPSVRACVLTSPFETKRGQALSAAPKWDAGRCSVARAGAGGVYEFDLSTAGPKGDGFGYVLAPSSGTAPPTFQVVFEPFAATASG
jgi:hypothetical protein